MPSQGWQHGLSSASGGASHPSYQYSNQPHGQAGFSHALMLNPPFQGNLDQVSGNALPPNRMNPQALPAGVQQPFFHIGTSAVEEQPTLSLVTNHSQGPDTPSNQPQASCCSSNKTIDQKHAEPCANQDIISEILGGSPQTTLYHIPTGLATYDNPLKPENQTGFEESSSDYMQTVPVYAESGVIGAAALPADTDETSGFALATMHRCRCGTGCQCVACPVHPGNATTQARVAEMYNLLDSEPLVTPTFETNHTWPSSQSPNEDINLALNSAYVVQMPQEGEVHRPHPGYLSPLHWPPPGSVPHAQFPTPESAPSLVEYPCSPADMDSPVGNGIGNDATPSQNYLHFQYPLHYMNGQ